MNNIYEAFYNNTKRIIECQRGGENAPANKINEIESAISMMESIIGEEDPDENS